MFYFVIEKAYYVTVGKNVTQGSYLIYQQFKITYTLRKIDTRCMSSLGHYFIPRLSKYGLNIYVGIWQKLIQFLISALFILVLLL